MADIFFQLILTQAIITHPSLQQEQHQLIKTDANDINFQRLDERKLEAKVTESGRDEIIFDNSQSLENNKGFANWKETKLQQPQQHIFNFHRNYSDIYMVLLMLGWIRILK
jgi:beta-galactosidase beta subunit